MLPKILLADDDPVSLKVLASLLASQAECTLTRDGAEASEQLKLHRFACVISDMQMPNLNGIELLAKAVQIAPQTPFILVSKFNDQEVLREAWKLGAFDFIQKPFTARAVREVLGLALNFGPSYMTNPDNAHRRKFFDAKPVVIWDREAFERSFGGDQTVVKEILKKVRSTMDEALVEIRKALSKGDMKELAQWLNKIKGTLMGVRSVNCLNAVIAMEKTLDVGAHITLPDVQFLENQYAQLEVLFN